MTGRTDGDRRPETVSKCQIFAGHLCRSLVLDRVVVRQRRDFCAPWGRGSRAATMSLTRIQRVWRARISKDSAVAAAEDDEIERVVVPVISVLASVNCPIDQLHNRFDVMTMVNEPVAKV